MLPVATGRAGALGPGDCAMRARGGGVARAAVAFSVAEWARGGEGGARGESDRREVRRADAADCVGGEEGSAGSMIVG